MANVKRSNRRILRERTLQILYAYEINGEGLTTLTDGILSDIDNKNDKEFAVSLVNKTIANRETLDEMIKGCVNNWEMERIAVIDRLLLRMGITEILYFPDIPPKVSINETIEIAKEYSTSNSGKFINGILDALLTDLRKSGKFTKTGRGLIEETLSKKD